MFHFPHVRKKDGTTRLGEIWLPLVATSRTAPLRTSFLRGEGRLYSPVQRELPCWSPSFTTPELLRYELDCGGEMQRRGPPTAAARHKRCLTAAQQRLDARRQLPSFPLRGGRRCPCLFKLREVLFSCLDAHVQQKCIFLLVVVLCPQVAPVFLFFALVIRDCFSGLPRRRRLI